jgi:hypothetical protein
LLFIKLPDTGYPFESGLYVEGRENGSKVTHSFSSSLSIAKAQSSAISRHRFEYRGCYQHPALLQHGEFEAGISIFASG